MSQWKGQHHRGDRIRQLTEAITAPMAFESDNSVMRYAKVKWHKSPTTSDPKNIQRFNIASRTWREKEQTNATEDGESKPEQVYIIQAAKITVPSCEDSECVVSDHEGLRDFQKQGAVDQELHVYWVSGETQVIIVCVISSISGDWVRKTKETYKLERIGRLEGPRWRGIQFADAQKWDSWSGEQKVMQYTKEERLQENNFNVAIQCVGLLYDSQWGDKAS